MCGLSARIVCHYLDRVVAVRNDGNRRPFHPTDWPISWVAKPIRISGGVERDGQKECVVEFVTAKMDPAEKDGLSGISG